MTDTIRRRSVHGDPAVSGRESPPPPGAIDAVQGRRMRLAALESAPLARAVINEGHLAGSAVGDRAGPQQPRAVA